MLVPAHTGLVRTSVLRTQSFVVWAWGWWMTWPYQAFLGQYHNNEEVREWT